MRLVLSGLFRRARRAALVVAIGLLPAPAFALMPWCGEGACSAMLSPGLRVADCDFRDYLDPGMPTPLSSVVPATASSPVAAQEGCHWDDDSDAPYSMPYDWSASHACGPTDWDCSTSAAAPAPVAEAVAAVAALCPDIPVAWLSWESVDAAFGAMQPIAHELDRQAELAEQSARAALRASARSAAGRLGGTLDRVGRQFLGAAAALSRVAGDDSGPVESTAARQYGPQPSMHPFGHLGL